MNYIRITFFFILLVLAACKTPQNLIQTEVEVSTCKNDSIRVAFYNVENLFDLVDNPEKVADEDFTPTGEKQWTRERLDKKIMDLSKVIKTLGGGSAPALLGLCEVENSLVLDELLDAPAFATGKYEYLHKDSPDRRGIDVCLLYNSELISILNWEALKVNFPNEPDYTSRDVVYAKVAFNNEEVAHVFVNHWPSRYGGAEVSEPRRIQAATIVKSKINKILLKDEEAKIILMGDFNDEPSNKSIKNIIQAAQSKSELKNYDLYNAFSHMLADTTKGTYNYRGKWNFLDQIIISKNLLNATEGYISNGKAGVLAEKWMLFFDKKTGSKPNRTYGYKYYGGFSDHLPIYIDLVCK